MLGPLGELCALAKERRFQAQREELDVVFDFGAERPARVGVGHFHVGARQGLLARAAEERHPNGNVVALRGEDFTRETCEHTRDDACQGRHDKRRGGEGQFSARAALLEERPRGEAQERVALSAAVASAPRRRPTPRPAAPRSARSDLRGVRLRARAAVW